MLAAALEVVERAVGVTDVGDLVAPDAEDLE
jgi:hypothetical protein